MGNKGKTVMPMAFSSLFAEPKMGGNKHASGKAYSKGNAAPKNFRPQNKK